MATVAEDELLEAAGHDGRFDVSKWPILLEHLLKRLDHIVHNEFYYVNASMDPITEFNVPGFVATEVAHTPTSTTAGGDTTVPASSVPGSGDVPPSASSPGIARSTPPASIIPATSTPPSGAIPNSQPSTGTPRGGDSASATETLPAWLLELYRPVQAALRSDFESAPPFTIQRVAELVQHPRQHYRSLHAYLRALDRAVTVSSPSTTFPLPALAGGGVSAADDSCGGGSYLAGGTAPADDFNAAALTRIPWLVEAGRVGSPPAAGATAANATSPTAHNGSSQRTTDLLTERTDRIDGPLGAGSIETVTVGSAHSGFVGGGHLGGFGGAGTNGGRAASQHRPTPRDDVGGGSGGTGSGSSDPLVQAPTLRSNVGADLGLDTAADMATDDDVSGTEGAAAATGEQLHARGPEEIGIADMGPQEAAAVAAGRPLLDAEAAIGRPGEAETVASPPEAMVRSPPPMALLEATVRSTPDEGMEGMEVEGKEGEEAGVEGRRESGKAG